MLTQSKFLRISLLISLFTGVYACKKPIETNPPETHIPGIRKPIDYSVLTPGTPYKNLFLNDLGDSTVDLESGNTRFKMFQALNYYLGAAVRDSKVLDSLLMQNMYAHTGDPFTDISSLSISGSGLNSSIVQLRNVTALSRINLMEFDRNRMDHLFGEMAIVSQYFSDTASKGKAGKLGNYLVDEKGIETAQIIQKSLIGAMQMDYICNVLLNTGLDADNKTILSGKKCTQLEQNWDEAYGFLTLNPVYLAGSTDAVRGTPESFLGSYIWEYNKSAYAKIYPAFLKGRAAIANNDMNEVKTQARFIRTEMEKALANAAIGYLGKWKSGSTDAARAHAIGEALGFIYALRFCDLQGVENAFSDNLIQTLTESQNGFWDLTNTKINSAADAITAKFKL